MASLRVAAQVPHTLRARVGEQGHEGTVTGGLLGGIVKLQVAPRAQRRSTHWSCFTRSILGVAAVAALSGRRAVANTINDRQKQTPTPSYQNNPGFGNGYRPDGGRQ